MSKAWQILLALTFARMTMGAQFQSIPALAPWLMEADDMSFVALGTLTGVYLLPGALIALIGGGLGQKFGDARVAFAGLFMMTLGGLGGWYANSFEAALAWRSFAGAGAVALNVLMTKMAADWFEGRDDLPTGMGVLVSSWPAGIALAALALPFVAANAGLNTALLLPTLFCAVGFVLVVIVWRDPNRAMATKTAFEGWLKPRAFVLVGIAGLIWAIYNVALIGTIVWTPGILLDTGLDPVRATARTSFIGWFAILSVAAGGWMAVRSSWQDAPAVFCFLVSACLVAGLPLAGDLAGTVWYVSAIGLSIGPAAAVVMTLPVVAAPAHLRALAMGIYFAIYYALMGFGPALFGALRDATGRSDVPLYVAAAMLLVCYILLCLFRAVQRTDT